MRSFSVNIEARSDIPALLNEALCNMGSIQASREQWASLLKAMGVDLWYSYHKDAPVMGVGAAAEAIVVSAVPEEGEIHPQRALSTHPTDGVVMFTTPGGVVVNISSTDEGITLAVEFNRESSYLATLILADLFRRVPAAAPLLAEVAAEAAAKYKATDGQ